MATEAEAKIAHTPGPWHVEGVYVFPNGYQSNPVCGVSRYLGQADGQISANARLIAAAPDLLRTLIGAIATWEKFYPLLPVRTDIEDAEFDEFNKARAAVCNALGLQPWEYHQRVAKAEGRS